METAEDIFPLSRPDAKVNCPFCNNGSMNFQDYIFQGIHLIGKYKCADCKGFSLHTLPIGHDLHFPISFDETGKRLNGVLPGTEWLVRPLLNSFFEGEKANVSIEKEVLRQSNDAILLNCLDNCFGHSFTKLWNLEILKSKYPDKSIIVFVPKRMRWLLPDYVDEVWSFDASFTDLEKFLVNLDEEVKKNLLPRFSNVFVSKAFTHLSLDKIDLRSFLKTDRFDLEKFDSTPPRITFVLREDRLWHRYSWEFLVFKIFMKLGLAKKIFIWRQNYLVSRAARMIKMKLSNAELYVAGLGCTGRLSSLMRDLRKKTVNVQDEMQWCDLYSSSHVIIGVHGSNMLIPTALAAGFIEILPRHKIRHIAEDTLINRNSRYSLFLGRHVDHFASPNVVSKHAVSMLNDFAYVHRNAQQG